MYDELFARNGLSLDRLRSFLRVKEAGGMTRAAGGDPTRQSLYSRQVKELEAYFGVKLFERVGKRLKPTPQGERLAVVIRECFGTLDDYRMDCGNQRHVFSIGAGEALLQWLVVPRLAGIQAKLEGIDLELRNLRTQDAVRQVDDLQTDFALVRKTAVSGRPEQARLGTLRYALFVSARGLGRQTPDWKAVLAGKPLATMGSDGEFRKVLQTAIEKAGIPFRIQVNCTSFPQAAQAVESGGCAAILPELAAEGLRDGSIRKVAVPFLRSQSREIVLVWNKRLLDLRGQAERMLAELKEALKF